jgi:hypothetical protein
MKGLALTLAFVSLAGCTASRSASPLVPDGSPGGSYVVRRAYGLGPVVQPKLAGTILGYDIDQHASDGVFANYNARSQRVSLETFDQSTGKVTKVVRVSHEQKGDYAVNGILASDVGFVSHDGYALMEPVTGGKLNGAWAPPSGFQVAQIAENQDSQTQAILGYDTSEPSSPTALVAANVAKGTSKLIALDQNLFNTGAVPVLAEDSATNQAVIAASVGGRTSKPTLGIVDLRTGKTTTFQGIGYGDVGGIGVDSKTGIACTTTGIDAGVEFYDLKTQKGFEVQIPGSQGSEEHSGSGVAVDSINGLCVVAQPVSGDGTQASAVWIVDEKGNFLEEITGFNFWFGVGPVIDPGKRIGYVLSPRPLYGTLAGFSY